MRYADAEHVNLAPFLMRSPRRGIISAVLGLCLVAVAMCYSHNQEVLRALLIVSMVGWIQAWMRQVGILWRGPLVAACLASAVGLTLMKLEMKVLP